MTKGKHKGGGAPRHGLVGPYEEEPKGEAPAEPEAPGEAPAEPEAPKPAPKPAASSSGSPNLGQTIAAVIETEVRAFVAQLPEDARQRGQELLASSVAVAARAMQGEDVDADERHLRAQALNLGAEHASRFRTHAGNVLVRISHVLVGALGRL